MRRYLVGLLWAYSVGCHSISRLIRSIATPFQGLGRMVEWSDGRMVVTEQDVTEGVLYLLTINEMKLATATIIATSETTNAVTEYCRTLRAS